MPRRGRRWRVVPILVLALTGIVASFWLGWAREFVFLVVDEANGLPPATWWTPEVPAAAHYGQGTLQILQGRVLPWHRVVCLHEVDAGGVKISSRILTGAWFPAHLRVDAPVPGLGSGQRVLAGSLRVLGAEGDGWLSLAYGGEVIRLRPGQSWAQLRIRGPRGEQVFSPEEGPAWEEAVGEALAGGWAVTRLVITYHGIWPRGSIAFGQAALRGGRGR